MCGLVMKKNQLKDRGGFIMYMIIFTTACKVDENCPGKKCIKYSELILSRLANWKDARINQKETRMSEDKEDFSGS